MGTWEYCIRDRCSESELNQLGIDGWELVSAVFNAYNRHTLLYFKRPTPSDAARA
ncbi:hypothetical protein [Nonomuraea sp. bgisy101]|uniref:hypothetical protein n=1 Tax=Nonomuraea sp. bgisy101 TaxID=3413784 RepID=UPI003D72123C